MSWSKNLGLGVLVIFCIIAFYASYKLTESPPTWYDEGIYIQVAQSFAEKGTQDIQITPELSKRIDFLTIGYPVIIPVAASMKLFGSTLFAARIAMVGFILLFTYAAWRLMKRLFDEKAALWSLALVGTFPLLYGNGKNVLGEIPGLLYATISLIALDRLEKRNYEGAWNYLFLGVAVGLTAASKPIFLLFPAGTAIALLLNIRSIPLKWKEILVAVLSFFIPMMLWAYFQFGPEASLSAILNYYANPYGIQTIPTTMIENFLRFFKETTPLYAAVLTCIWLAAIFVRLYRREKISLAEQSALFFSMLVFAAYLRTAGWYRYFFEALCFAVLFFAPSLQILVSTATRRFSKLPHSVHYAGTAALCVLIGMQFYQLNFSSWVAEYYQSTRSSQVQAFFQAYPKDRSIFVFNSPAAVVFLASRNYYQYLQPTAAIGYGNDELELVRLGIPDDVLISPDQYEANPQLFTRYATSTTAGAYLILSRKKDI